MSSAGEFTITVATGGYPAWCALKYAGNELARFSHKELSDLAYAVRKAEQEARAALPEQDKHEIL